MDRLATIALIAAIVILFYSSSTDKQKQLTGLTVNQPKITHGSQEARTNEQSATTLEAKNELRGKPTSTPVHQSSSSTISPIRPTQIPQKELTSVMIHQELDSQLDYYDNNTMYFIRTPKGTRLNRIKSYVADKMNLTWAVLDSMIKDKHSWQAIDQCINSINNNVKCPQDNCCKQIILSRGPKFVINACYFKDKQTEWNRYMGTLCD